MGSLTFFSQARLLVVTGKGGVGKTTVSGVIANLAARTGLRAIVVQITAPGAQEEPEAAHLSRLFGQDEPVDYEGIVLSAGTSKGEVRARAVRPDAALVEYLHLHGMRRLTRRLVASGALDVVATAVPGMPDMLVLGKLKQMERAAATGQPDAADFIILDAPAAGHAIRFLQSPHGLLEAANGGPIQAQAQEVVDMLADPSRCQVLLVTTPEETPVSETIETARLLEEKAGTTLPRCRRQRGATRAGPPARPRAGGTREAHERCGCEAEHRGTGEPVRSWAAPAPPPGVPGFSSGQAGHRAAPPTARTSILFQLRARPQRVGAAHGRLCRGRHWRRAGPPVSPAAAEVVVCVGPGGVGKTTTAAAIALQGAAPARVHV